MPRRAALRMAVLGQSGTALVAAFGRNPHRGDAIIATFFWVGSTVVIDSVTDFLTDASSTRVGNTYNLVESVAAAVFRWRRTWRRTSELSRYERQPEARGARASLGGGSRRRWSGFGVERRHGDLRPTPLGVGSGQTTTVAALADHTRRGLARVRCDDVERSRRPRRSSQGFTILPCSPTRRCWTRSIISYRRAGARSTRGDVAFTQRARARDGTLARRDTGRRVRQLVGDGEHLGVGLDPNGYTVTVDQTTSQPLPSNGGSATFTGLATGTTPSSLSGSPRTAR